MKIILGTLSFIVLITLNSSCQNKSSRKLKTGDKYSEFVVDLEKGVTNIDYKIFRESLLQSEHYNVIKNNTRQIDSLGNMMFNSAKTNDVDKVIEEAKRVLSIDYTNLMAHKMIRQAYQSKNDSTNERKHRQIETGLLNSILNSGTGTSCKTGWVVIQVTEEGFILQMLGGEVINMEMQDLCDHFTVKSKETEEHYYFKRYNKRVK